MQLAIELSEYKGADSSIYRTIFGACLVSNRFILNLDSKFKEGNHQEVLNNFFNEIVLKKGSFAVGEHPGRIFQNWTKMYGLFEYAAQKMTKEGMQEQANITRAKDPYLENMILGESILLRLENISTTREPSHWYLEKGDIEGFAKFHETFLTYASNEYAQLMRTKNNPFGLVNIPSNIGGFLLDEGFDSLTGPYGSLVLPVTQRERRTQKEFGYCSGNHHIRNKEFVDEFRRRVNLLL